MIVAFVIPSWKKGKNAPSTDENLLHFPMRGGVSTFLKVPIPRTRSRVKCELTAKLCSGKVMVQAGSGTPFDLINLKV